MALRSSTEPGQARASHAVTIDSAMARKAAAELLGTALLVFFGAGVATVTFGFRAYGGSIAAGVLTVGMAFGLVLLALVAFIGPISGCHVNPAVTLAAFLSRRMSILDFVSYWIAQIIGGILGALLLLWVMHSSPFYIKSRIGLGANGYGTLSLLHTSGGGAFLAEVILTAVFVLIWLSATRKEASVAVAAVVIGLALGVVNIMGTPIDGTSVNPARSLGPAVLTGGQALGQVWLFLIAPLVGAVLATGVYMLFYPAGKGTAAKPGTTTPMPAQDPSGGPSTAPGDPSTAPGGPSTPPGGGLAL